jgi:hypothetical protein
MRLTSVLLFAMLAACHADPLGIPAGGNHGTPASMSAGGPTPVPTPPMPDACTQHTDEASCQADPACAVSRSGCSCDGTPPMFDGCYPSGDPRIGTPCFCPIAPCEAVTDQATCDARSDCYAVFDDPGTCDCAGIGCCMIFSQCATGSPMCFPAPSNGQPCTDKPSACGPAYDPIYDGAGCIEGGVHATLCTPAD